MVDSLPLLANSNMTRCGDSLYVYSTEWNWITERNTVTYAIVDTRIQRVVSRNFITDGTRKRIKIPYGVAVNPNTHEIFATDAKDYVTPRTRQYGQEHHASKYPSPRDGYFGIGPGLTEQDRPVPAPPGCSPDYAPPGKHNSAENGSAAPGPLPAPVHMATDHPRTGRKSAPDGNGVVPTPDFAVFAKDRIQFGNLQGNMFPSDRSYLSLSLIAVLDLDKMRLGQAQTSLACHLAFIIFAENRMRPGSPPENRFYSDRSRLHYL